MSPFPELFFANVTPETNEEDIHAALTGCGIQVSRIRFLHEYPSGKRKNHGFAAVFLPAGKSLDDLAAQAFGVMIRGRGLHVEPPRQDRAKPEL